LFAAGVRVKLDDRSESMGYKIREALQGNKVPYVLVMGDKEIEEGKVAVRIRGIGEAGKMSIDDFVQTALTKIQTKTQDLTF
jgi:threonyl-tRNA synthetase